MLLYANNIYNIVIFIKIGSCFFRIGLAVHYIAQSVLVGGSGRMKLCAEQTSHTESQHPYLLKNLPQPCVFSFLAYGIKICMGFLVAYGNMHAVAWKFGMVHREVA